MRATSWQLPPDGEACCDDTAAPADDFFNSRTASNGTDECRSISYSRPSRDMVLLDAALRKACSALPSGTPPPEADAEGEKNSLHQMRPFLSLMLPEWVHEKSAEDEAAGVFRCRSLASFNPSPTSSSASSPASSCLGSPVSSRARTPEVPSEAESTPSCQSLGVRRSGVRWADLAEESEEDDLTFTWAGSAASTASTVSTADSSPVTTTKGSLISGGVSFVDHKYQHETAAHIVIASENFNSQDFPGADRRRASSQSLPNLQCPQRDGQAHVCSTACEHSGVRWVDLLESDVDPLDYTWRITPPGHSAVCWADLEESDLDPLDYQWSLAADDGSNCVDSSSASLQPRQGAPMLHCPSPTLHEVGTAGCCLIDAESMGQKTVKEAYSLEPSQTHVAVPRAMGTATKQQELREEPSVGKRDGAAAFVKAPANASRPRGRQRRHQVASR